MDLDDTEVPDNQGSIIKARSQDGTEHLYFVMRDWDLNRWAARHNGLIASEQT